MALAVPLSRFTPQVGGGSAFFVRRLRHEHFTMKGLEILVNGKKQRFLPVSAKASASFQVQWLVTKLPSDYIFVAGMKLRLDGSTKDPIVWQSEDFKPGDEITVRIVGKPASQKKTKRVR